MAPAAGPPRASHDERVVTRSRILPLVGAFNFRDLGGYRTLDGRSTRWGRLFRSDGLHELTSNDLDVLRDLGLACVIDLRTPAELERTGRGPLEQEPIRYFHLPLLPGGDEVAPEAAQQNLTDRYFWYLDVGRQSFVEAFGLVADPKSYPLVFHCAAGKDRTGVLAALVLSVLGVERSVIVEDYVLTQSRMDLIMARMKRNADSEDRMAEIPQFLFRAEVGTISAFLEQLDERFGGARQWALDAGVTSDQLDALVGLLVSDSETP
jgi:protein-tyrosine phosphatase